jgi:hypothetical protein
LQKLVIPDMLPFIFLPVLLTAQSPKYGKCNVNKFGRSDLVNKTIPIVSVLTASPISIKGQIAIVDGCTFETREFEFLNGGESYWVGGYKGSKEAMTLSDQYVPPSAFKRTFKYSLKATAGSEANFDGFDQFRLFERNSELLIAVADMPAKSGNSGQSAGTTTGSSGQSGAYSGSFGITSILLTGLAFVL